MLVKMREEQEMQREGKTVPQEERKRNVRRD